MIFTDPPRAVSDESMANKYSGLKMMSEPKILCLLKYALQAPKDRAHANTTFASILTTFWHLSVSPGVYKFPSLLFIAPDEADPLAIEKFRDLLYVREHLMTTEDFKSGVPYRNAREKLEESFEQQVKLTRNNQTYRPNPFFKDLHKQVYGVRAAYRYTHAWNKKMGLVTESDRAAAILSITQEGDFKAFRQDLMKNPERITRPQGANNEGTDLINKKACFTGTIRARGFDAELLDQMLELNIPFLFMPHPELEVKIDNPNAIEHLARQIRQECRQLENKLFTVPQRGYREIDWIDELQLLIWDRLSHIPLQTRFVYLELLHQIDQTALYISTLCSGVDCQMAAAGSKTAIQSRMVELLKQLVIQGHQMLYLSLRTLAWHGLGFHLDCDLKKVRKTLSILRTDGPQSHRDLQRRVKFKTAAERDLVIAQLTAESLVTIDGKNVSAVSWSEFSYKLHNDPELPQLIILPDGVAEKK